MVMNTRAKNVIIFFIVTHGMVLNSDGSEKFQFRKRYKDHVTRTTTTQSPLSTTDGTAFNSSICSQDPAKGDCRAHLENWYYNSTSGNCSVFYYGGCRGNKNRFDTCQECMRNCRFQNVSETDSNITAICNELEQAAEENDSWEDGLPEASGNESTEHHALAYRGN
uniref:Amyloid beta (A4)-like protein 2 n=1 Tax=Rhipicephalus zambeziensis TaxID=60191 RepID=A0A224Y7D1_9ACAR